MTDAEAALVRAIRRVYRDPRDGDNTNGGVVMFRVEDIFAFAAALVREGVTVTDEQARAA